MNFFCTKKHFEDWLADNGGDMDGLFALDAEDAFKAADIVFGRHEDRVTKD